MKNLELDTHSGHISANGKQLDLSTADDALRTALAAGVQARLMARPSGPELQADIDFLGEPFTLSCKFPTSGQVERTVVLTWASGRVTAKGWDSTESDLMADRDDLAQLFSAKTALIASDLSPTVKVFNFRWGRVLAGCSLQAMLATLSICW